MSSASPSKRQRVIVSILLACLLLAAGTGISYGLALLRKPPEVREATRRTYNVEVYTVTPIDLREIINAFGTAVPDKEVVLSSQVAGEVDKIHPHLKVGMKVRGAKLAQSPLDSPDATQREQPSDREDQSEQANQPQGIPPAEASANGDSEPLKRPDIASTSVEEQSSDLLVQIDRSNYHERVISAKLRLEEDDAELRRIDQESENLRRLHEKIDADYKDSKREYQKSAELREKGINTDSDLRRALMELRQHEKNLVQNGNDSDLLPVRREVILKRIEGHRADLRISELDLTRTQLRSPFDGIISAVQVEQGQYVRVGESLVTITSDQAVDIPIAVPLEDYNKILPVVLERQFPSVELAENETARPRWKGRVLRAAPKVDEQTRTALVYVRVENRDQPMPLLPGTFVHARIDGPVLKHVLVIPRDAIPGGRVFVERDGIVQERSIVTSRLMYGLVVVESGIESGDRVILTNHDVLFEGASVSISGTKTLEDELARQRVRTARLVDAGTAKTVIEESRDE